MRLSTDMPRTVEDDTNPTELASVVFGPLHYAFLEFVVQRPVSTEASSVGFVIGFRAFRIRDYLIG